MARVLIAMSGGVDSSVAAAVLQEQGHEVIGVTMQVWDYTQSECSLEGENGTCCSSLDVDDARAVADHLDIPFYVLNCEDEFKSKVIDNFVDTYLSGDTPIPCVNCNTFLKFDHLVRKMHELNCDYIATGHYAQIFKAEDGKHRIFTSSDDWKDQTYFLFTLRPDLLDKILFPVGGWKKPDLRRYAEEKGLPVFAKKDSVGICFIGKKGYAGFIEERAPKDRLRPGNIVHIESQKVLAQHEGVHRFTIGQRRGLGVATGDPLYVVKIDPETSTVYLGEEKHLYRRSAEIRNLNLLDEIETGEPLRVKIRYSHGGAEALVFPQADGQARIEFSEPQRSITRGQAAVMYRGAQLVGGGWIASC